jgi:uncharacterized OB-fold protein
LGKQGIIISWTNIQITGTAFQEYAPYPVALVGLETGERVYGELVDYDMDDIAIGREVRSVLRKGKNTGGADVVEYTLKFMPS